MSSFLYFFPNLPNLGSVDKIPASCELGEVLKGASVSFRQVENAIDGQSGTIASVQPSSKEGTETLCGYFPEKQTWLAVDNAEGAVSHYIGFENAAPPQASDLRRAELAPGYRVSLGEETFIVPIINLAITTLPQPYRWAGKGRAFLAVPDGYKKLTEQAQNMLERKEKQQNALAVKEKITPEMEIRDYEYFTFAVAVLGINYRLGVPEVCSIGLLNNVNVQEIVDVALGIRAFTEYLADQKKTSGAAST
jgi:hypothetical protein